MAFGAAARTFRSGIFLFAMKTSRDGFHEKTARAEHREASAPPVFAKIRRNSQAANERNKASTGGFLTEEAAHAVYPNPHLQEH
jgi:hypothetical protein